MRVLVLLGILAAGALVWLALGLFADSFVIHSGMTRLKVVIRIIIASILLVIAFAILILIIK